MSSGETTVSAPASAIGRDILLTIVSQGVVAATQFLQYRIVRQSWGIEALSAYTMAYRVRGALEWIVVVVLPLAIARYMSAETQAIERARFAVAGVGAGGMIMLLTCALLLIFPAAASGLLFGDARYDNWIAPFCALLGAYTVFMLASGMLRGLFAFRAANAINVLAIAIVPTTCLLLGRGNDLPGVVVIMGLSSTATTLATAAWVLRRERTAFAWPARGQWRLAEPVRQLLGFGIPRLATLGFSALFSIALPWLLARSGEREVLANVNVLLALLGAAALITSPVGFVLLPHFSRSFAGGEHERAVAHLRMVSAATIFCGLVSSALAVGLTPDVLGFLVGGRQALQGPLILALALVLPLFLFVDVLRSPLDAMSRIPFNALTYLAGAVGTVGTFLLPLPFELSVTMRCVISLVAGYLLAAVTAVISASRLAGAGLFGRNDVVLAAAWTAAICVWFALSAHSSSPIALGRWYALGMLAACAAYVFRAKPPWFQRLIGVLGWRT